MVDRDYEQAVAAEWSRLETLVCGQGLLTDEVGQLLQAMRPRVRLYRQAGELHFRAEVQKPEFEQLLRYMRPIARPLRKRLDHVTGPSSLSKLLGHLHNRVLLEEDIGATRSLFGLETPPSDEFLSTAAAVTDLLCSTAETAELLRECAQRAPARVREVTDRELLAAACATDADVLYFIDWMAQRVETAAIALLQIVRRGLYLPDRNPTASSPEEADQYEQRSLRDFLHWLALVIHRYRHYLFDTIKWYRLSPLANLAAELLEHSLFEAALLLMLQQRYPELFAHRVCPPAPVDEDEWFLDEAFAAEVAESCQVKASHYDMFLGWLDVLVGQWEHLAAQHKVWQTGDLGKTHQHLKNAGACLGNLRNLDVLAAVSQNSDGPQLHRTSKLPRPPIRHTALLQASQRGLMIVLQAEHTPGWTNQARISQWRQGRQNLPAASVVLHHADGRPCLFPYGLIPIEEIFPTESRLVQTANWLASKCDWLLATWEEACLDCQLGNRLTDMRLREATPVTLVSHVELVSHDEFQGACTMTRFLLPVDQVGHLFEARDLEPLSVEDRSLYEQYKIRVPQYPLGYLVWLHSEEDEEPE